jgi:hypothetical protein
MNELQVKASTMPIYLIGVLAALLLPMSIYLLVSAVSGGLKVVPLGLGLAMIGIVVGSALLFKRGHGRSIKVFKADGVATNGGQQFQWNDLSRVVHKMSIKPGSEKRRLWRTEVQFGSGSAWIIPSKVKNYSEVSAFVNGLQCEHVQEDA